MAQRYFVPELPPEGPFAATGDLAHHLGRVLRVRAGDRLRLGDGRGGRADATVDAVERQAVRLVVGPPAQRDRLRPAVVLAFACPRAQRTEWLFEHATEIGVAAFRPLWCERSRPWPGRAERWRRVVLAAAGQCDRDWLPDVAEPCAFADLLVRSDLPAARLLADRDGEPLGPPDAATTDAVLLVGPEGGFTDDERTAARAAGFAPRRLGPHTLRTETAAAVGAAILLASARAD